MEKEEGKKVVPFGAIQVMAAEGKMFGETPTTFGPAVSPSPTQANEARPEIMDSTILAKCNTFEDSLWLSMAAEGLNIKEAAYLIGYGNHPEQLSRMLSGTANFPVGKLMLWMEKINEIPLRWINLKSGWGMVRLSSYLEKRNEELEKEVATKDERIKVLEDLLKKRD